MEINKDEAIRCLSIAKNHYGNGNYAAAVRFTTKSINLYPTKAARSFLEKAQRASASTSTTTSSAPSPKNPSTTPKTASPPPQQSLPNSSEKKYTSYQTEAVKRILECGTDYYKVLSLEKNCTDVQIKKSYRRLALQFHPDKNSAPGADEAFKLISKAFSVLSDPQKRSIYDAGGGDPEQRRSSTSWNFRTQYEEEISPEDLFNMFFGPTATATANGSGFSSATFVGPGFAPHTYYRNNSGGAGHPASSHHHHHHQQWSTSSASKAAGAENSNGTMAILLQILPLVILFGYSLLSGLFSDYSSITSRPPAFSLKPTTIYSQPRMTQSHQVPYYVNPSAFRIMEGNQYHLSRVEQQVEIDWMRSLQEACQNERRERASRMNAVSGTIFGIGRDEEQYQAARKMPLKSCDQAKQFGYNINTYRR